MKNVFKRVLSGVLLFLAIWSIKNYILPIRANAAELSLDYLTFSFGGNSVPYQFGVSANTTNSYKIQYTLDEDGENYPFLILEFCFHSNYGTSADRFSITNNATLFKGSKFNPNNIVTYNSGRSCSYGNWTGQVRYVQLQVSKFYVYDNGIGYGVEGTLNFVSKLNYFMYNELTNVYISKEDYLTDYENQQKLEQGIDSIKQEQQATNNKLDETNNKLEDINSTLTDDTPPNSDISSLGNVQGLLPPGPLDSLLNIPFKLLSIINSSFGGVCKLMNIEFIGDSELNIPCFDDYFWNKVDAGSMIFLNIIPASFILVYYLKHLYKKVDRAMSLETNADDEWGVI